MVLRYLERIAPKVVPRRLWGPYADRGAWVTIRPVADQDSNESRSRFERKLGSGPTNYEDVTGHPEFQLDAAAKKRLQDRLRLIEEAQREGYAASRDQYLK
jgi:hypothetical protein